MDRIKHYQQQIKELRRTIPNAKCRKIKAELRFELAMCQLTICAIRYGLALGYWKGGK